MKKSWEIKKMSDVLLIERGGSPRPIDKYITNDPDGLNWIKISDATASNKYIYETKEKITKEGLHKTRLVKEGDFILSNSMSFGRPYIMKTTGCIHDGWLLLRDKNEKPLNKDFLYYLLSSPIISEQLNKLAVGSTVRNLNIGLVSSVEIPIPPLPEQEQLVSILDECFATIEQAKTNTEKNLNNAKELFQSELNKIFSEKGEGWIEKNIREVCKEVFAGGDAPEGYSKEKTEKNIIPIFANAVTDNGLYGYTDIPRVTEPSITIAGRGSGTGHTEVRTEPYLPIVRLIVLIPNLSLVTLDFLKYSIKNLKILRSGSAIPQLTIPMITEYKMPLPSISEQQKIVSQLNTLSVETKNLENIYQRKLNELEDLKKSILQKAFSGELVKEKNYQIKTAVVT
ncbi:MAG: restriction endonuclease subunit S [Bacteroidia bacterium]